MAPRGGGSKSLGVCNPSLAQTEIPQPVNAEAASVKEARRLSQARGWPRCCQDQCGVNNANEFQGPGPEWLR